MISPHVRQSTMSACIQSETPSNVEKGPSKVDKDRYSIVWSEIEANQSSKV
jgi:hypothetical protein